MPRNFLLRTPALCLALFLSGTSAVFAAPEVASVGNATSLLARHVELQPQLQAKALGEPVYLVSQDSGSRLQADLYAELPLSFAQLSGLLSTPDSLCAVMFLHLNVRACQPTQGAAGAGVVLTAGPRQAVTGGSVYTMNYGMRVEASAADYARVALTTASGPLSTSDYRIVFEVAPLDAQRSFLRFGYGYSYGTMAKMALGIYLSTAGRNKIGFTVVGTTKDGKPQFVHGERGSIERNVMRNFLALQAYTSVPGPVGQPQLDARLRAWFALSERHAPQLHEVGLDEYLAQKHEDLAHPPATR